MNEPDDSELERYLAGDHPVSARYRDATDEAPPAALDAAVRRQAHEAVSNISGRQRRWLRPVAAAAVFVLGMGMVFELQHDPGTQSTAIRARSDSAERAALKQHRGNSAPAPELRAVPDQASPRQLQSQPLAKPQASVSATDRVPIQPTADTQISHIRQLLEAGQRDAAVAALERLLDRHPDYPLPDRLARLAEAEDLRP